MAEHQNKYSAKTLVGNWYEQRCDPVYDETNTTGTLIANPMHNRYESTTSGIGDNATSTKEVFAKSSGNWLNFQGNGQKNYETVAMGEFCTPQKQGAKHSFKGTSLTNDQEKLEEYRKRWTQQPHQMQRTYQGAKPFKKC
eukprot:CAMPEP_0115010184 /NCGR_PEP_ID=MMETSP0216-20121206/23142_1 /TAXON_ID=223996 /ORGANISM="Protocruzia adherens, Strain Boccale" /LENGTH=139 /DNA_ID=CAMNT_0002378305 /DNA_START=31 /DNA_END=450 /DNA_ORIENTATION=-